jgi:riboflavin synthase
MNFEGCLEMFAGIVEQLTTVISTSKPTGKTASIQLNLGTLRKGVRTGDSLCVNGVCLTVTRIRKGIVSLNVIEETLRVTNLGELVKGSKVNIERSLRLSDRIDGHIVSGHIDGKGKIARVQRMPDKSVKTWIETETRLTSMMIPKGSVAVDGISLTLVDVKDDSFSVCLIPHTLSKTTLGYKTKGATVNIEADMMGKYVRKSIEQMNPPTLELQ